MLNDDLITVVDNDGTSQHPWGKVSSLVVLLSGVYYFKHADKYVTRILGPDNKRRFYRKESPLVTPDPEHAGEYLLKSMCHQTEDGVFLSKSSPNIVCIDGKYVRKVYAANVEGVWYSRLDPRVVVCKSSGDYILKEKAVLLDERYYNSGKYVATKYATKDRDDRNIMLKHAAYIIAGLNGEPQVVHNSWLGTQRTQNIVYDFQDKTNPQADRLTYMPILTQHSDMLMFVDLLPIIEGIPPGHENDSAYMNNPIVIHKASEEYFKKQIRDYIVPKHKKELEEIRRALNSVYSDLDDTENTAPIFKVVTEQVGGKVNIYTAGHFPTPVSDRKFIHTGGLKYSYGIEFETSQGMLSPKIITDLGISCVGDRSIGAGEYVTPPLEGNNGMDLVKRICEALNRHTLVDDRCGVHVHVGGLTKDKRPSFSKQTLMNAVILGCLIEEELFSLMPESRSTTLYHCHSIRRFGKITKSTYAKYMGAYIFGPKEWWLDPKVVGHDTLMPFFEFDGYKLGPGRTSSTGVEQWCGGRYKWLNLVHAFMKKDTKTYEFRIFPGTTNFKKVWAYIMLSLAFVNVIDNHTELIKEGVTIKDLVDVSFEKFPVIRKTLNEFHEARKAKFNRKNIYPAVGYKNQPLTFLTK